MQSPTAMRALLLLATVGCAGPDLEVSTDLAHLEVASLDMYIGSFTMWGDLRPVRVPSDPCPVLGTDFHARIGKHELSTFPGAREETCHSPDNANPCTEGPARCAPPFVSLAWPPPLPIAELTIADRSRAITCALGNALAARTMERVDAATWTVTPGASMTVRVSPASDLVRFAVEVYFIQGTRPIITVPHTVAGDSVTFTVPSLSPGLRRLFVHLDGEESVDCDVPARALHSYVIEQVIDVQ